MPPQIAPNLPNVGQLRALTATTLEHFVTGFETAIPVGSRSDIWTRTGFRGEWTRYERAVRGEGEAREAISAAQGGALRFSAEASVDVRVRMDDTRYACYSGGKTHVYLSTGVGGETREYVIGRCP